MIALAYIGVTFAMIDAFLTGAKVGQWPTTRERALLRLLYREWTESVDRIGDGDAWAAWLVAAFGSETVGIARAAVRERH